jgi:hypothetical protein
VTDVVEQYTIRPKMSDSTATTLFMSCMIR